ncbi:hypothetical protein YC2023_072885 [Brassica napus]
MANFKTTELQANIDWCCSDSGGFRNCTTIQRGRICYEPNTLRDQVSFVVNLYYQNLGATKAQCDFSGTGTQSRAHYSTSRVGPEWRQVKHMPHGWTIFIYFKGQKEQKIVFGLVRSENIQLFQQHPKFDILWHIHISMMLQNTSP